MGDGLLSNRARRRLRVFAISWTCCCVVLGVLAAWQVLELRSGTTAMDDAGAGLVRTAGSLDELGALPLVGDDIETAAETVGHDGEAVRRTAADLHDTILLLAIVVGLSIAVLPTVPILFLAWLAGTRPGAG
jgi:hypothetical protein